MKAKAKKTKRRTARQPGEEPATADRGVGEDTIIKPAPPTRPAGDNLRRRAEWFRRRTAGTSN